MLINQINIYILIKIYVILTFIFGLVVLNKRVKINRILIWLIGISASTEIINWALLHFGYPIKPVVNIWIVFHHALWLFLFYSINPYKNTTTIVITGFLGYGFINAIEIEGFFALNYNTYLLGALGYIIIFLIDSFKKLSHEKFSYFYTNEFILLSAPIIFYFGTSLMFGFRGKEITKTVIYNDFDLYHTIIYFVNLIYYTIVNLFIYRNIGLKNK